MTQAVSETPQSRAPSLIRQAIGTGVTIIVALAVVLGLISVVLLAIGVSPAAAASDFISGSIGNANRRVDIVMRALPMLLVSSGLLLTYTAGLWNIGIEGQVMMGAVFATIMARAVPDNFPGIIALPVELVLAMIGGALWAALAAFLKTRGNVNEIFGGVALNFVANNILIYLVSGPWKEGSYTTTAPFTAPALLPESFGIPQFSLIAVIIAVVAFLIIFFTLRGTRWGLQLKAMGKSEKSAFLLGVRTSRNVLLSMVICGAYAGLAGAYQVLSPISDRKLGASASGGIGFLGVLIVLLVNIQALWVPFVTLFFAIVPVGALKLGITLNLDSALGNVFQSALVLAILISNGIRARLQRRGE